MTLFKCRGKALQSAARRSQTRRQTVDSIEDVSNFVKSALRYDDEKPDQKFRRGKLVKKNKKNDQAWAARDATENLSIGEQEPDLTIYVCSRIPVYRINVCLQVLILKVFFPKVSGLFDILLLLDSVDFASS